jgi:membrane associated rhomboid family serine protease
MQLSGDLQGDTPVLFPYNTDAPIYYWPFATVGTIVVNTLIFLAIVVMPEEQQIWVGEHFVLLYGTWNPLQWLTSNYLHGDWLHLLGNMFVLWGIGIIVEGKIGWWRFLLLYNGLGIFQCGAEQTLMLFAQQGGSFGASAIIFGLIAIVLLWAPRNELDCLLIFYRITTLEVTVAAYAGFSLAVQVILGAISVMTLSAMDMFIGMTSEILHLMGAASGFVVGVAMLRWKWVDCEDWDLFSVWQGRHLKSREELAEEALMSEEGQAKLARHYQAMREQFRNYLAANEVAAALAVHSRGKVQFGRDWRIEEEEHVHLISGLRKTQNWEEAVKIMVEYLRTFTKRAPVIRLALAQLLLEQLGRPNQALKVLKRLDPRLLPPKQQPIYGQLVQRTEAAAAEDPFEVATDDW